ncbi:MAG: hypothetical protein N3E47_02010 [Candidatus Bathyarchaeota archaeon]|nr:hypothetical protein [Candidatus Bathyarchaeota archaeon]
MLCGEIIVFVEHAADDLETLKPFLERLLKYFDGDVTVILFGSYARWVEGSQLITENSKGRL